MEVYGGLGNYRKCWVFFVLALVFVCFSHFLLFLLFTFRCLFTFRFVCLLFVLFSYQFFGVLSCIDTRLCENENFRYTSVT